MAIRRKQTQEETEQTLASQIGDLGNDLNIEADGGVQQEVYDDVAEEAPSTNMATQMIGKKLNRLPGAMSNEERERDKEFIKSQNLSRIGQKIGETTRVREGWLPVDRTTTRRKGCQNSSWCGSASGQLCETLCQATQGRRPLHGLTHTY